MFKNLFSKRGLSLDRLGTFCKIAETGSISKAAGGDSNKQSQYSRQLKELEEFFGTELVQRRGGLTHAGNYLFETCVPLLNSLDKIAGDISGIAPEISIGSGDAVLNWIVFPTLAVLRNEFPNAGWRMENLRTNEINERLLDFRLDFGILRKKACSPKLKTVPLGVMKFALFVPHGLRSAKIPTACLAGAGDFQETLERIAPKIRPPIHVKIRCASFPSIMNAVRSGAAGGILPTMAQKDLPSEKFQIFKQPLLGRLDRKYVLATNPRGIAMRPFLQRVQESLLTRCRIE